MIIVVQFLLLIHASTRIEPFTNQDLSSSGTYFLVVSRDTLIFFPLSLSSLLQFFLTLPDLPGGSNQLVG